MRKRKQIYAQVYKRIGEQLRLQLCPDPLDPLSGFLHHRLRFQICTPLYYELILVLEGRLNSTQKVFNIVRS